MIRISKITKNNKTKTDFPTLPKRKSFDLNLNENQSLKHSKTLSKLPYNGQQ